MPDPGVVPVRVDAPEELDFASAPDFERALHAAFATGADVVADFGTTTFCDSSGLKVLVQAAKHAGAHGQRFEIRDPPRMLCRTATILGASSLLGLPVVSC